MFWMKTTYTHTTCSFLDVSLGVQLECKNSMSTHGTFFQVLSLPFSPQGLPQLDVVSSCLIMLSGFIPQTRASSLLKPLKCVTAVRAAHSKASERLQPTISMCFFCVHSSWHCSPQRPSLFLVKSFSEQEVIASLVVHTLSHSPLDVSSLATFCSQVRRPRKHTVKKWESATN